MRTGVLIIFLKSKSNVPLLSKLKMRKRHRQRTKMQIRREDRMPKWKETLQKFGQTAKSTKEQHHKTEQVCNCGSDTKAEQCQRQQKRSQKQANKDSGSGTRQEQVHRRTPHHPCRQQQKYETEHATKDRHETRMRSMNKTRTG